VDISYGGPDLGVTEQPSGHFQRGHARVQQGSNRVAQIMGASVGNVGLDTHPLSEPFEIDGLLAWDFSGEQELAAFGHVVGTQADPHPILAIERHLCYCRNEFRFQVNLTERDRRRSAILANGKPVKDQRITSSAPNRRSH